MYCIGNKFNKKIFWCIMNSCWFESINNASICRSLSEIYEYLHEHPEIENPDICKVEYTIKIIKRSIERE